MARKKAPDTKADYAQSNRERSARISREKSAAARDCGPIRAVVDPVRRAKCRESLELFCRTYFNENFSLPFSADHRTVIAKIELAVIKGGLFAVAMPRGSGKTTLCETATLWAILYGWHPFVVLIGADKDSAVQMLASIKIHLEGGNLLAADFPEVIQPIEALEGEAKRCAGQTCDGERTSSQWSKDTIVLPTIKGSIASGAIIRTAGITGRIRGLKFTRRIDRKSIRPTLVLVDDPQTRESAYSISQCETRERTVAADILGLKGPDGRRISGVMPCTVIRQGDMADRILDTKIYPAWNGSRMKMLYEFPAAKELWEEYKTLLTDFNPHIPGDSARAESAASSYYFEHADAMNAGARVAWPERFDPHELSAIQHAMNLYIRDEKAFMAEYQNEPMPDVIEAEASIKPEDVFAKLNGIPRGEVPVTCSQLTAFIDVQGEALYWVCVAWEPGFGGAVIDYGTFPDQRVQYFLLNDLKQPLSRVFGGSLESNIYGGLSALTTHILGKDWPRQDGTTMRVERCMIDANWGDSTAVVRRFCRESPFRQVLLPSHGRGLGASSQSMLDRKQKDGERLGLNWSVALNVKASIRQVTYDTNFWKSFLSLRIKAAMGSSDSLTVFGDDKHAHRMYADHLSAESPTRVTAERSGRVVDEWKLIPNRENHWFDCTVGAAVAASIQGVSLAGVHQPTRPKKAKKKIDLGAWYAKGSETKNER